MEKINFVNNVTKASAETFNTMQDNIEDAINDVDDKVDELKPVILYDDTTGSTGNITLNETSANFKYIDVFAEKSGCYGFTRCANPNGKQIGIAIHNAYGTTDIQQIFARYSISGTTMTKDHELYILNNGSPTSSNDLAIIKVVGYK